jgi:hypothetical protein
MAGAIFKTLGAVAAWTIVYAAVGPALAQELGKPGAASLYGPSDDDVASVPTDAEMMAAWPAKAAARKQEGSAAASCKTDAAGLLSHCTLMLQRPSNGEFGAALLSLAPKFHLQRVAEGKRAADTDVVITASWPAVDTTPDWRVPPKPGDFATTLTDAAWRSGGNGMTVMNCLAGRLGTLYQCVVVYQVPAGKGFGTMMLRFADYLRLKPAQIAGKPVPTGLNIVFHFVRGEASQY